MSFYTPITTGIQTDQTVEATHLLTNFSAIEVAITGLDQKLDSYTVANVKSFGAKGDFNYVTKTGTDDTQAIRAALATGRRVYFPKGLYRVTDELEVTHAGQVIEFENAGGYGEGLGAGTSINRNTFIVATGTFAKRVRTRRKWRGSSSDPQDDPISVVWNIQAHGCQLINVAVDLWCDYSNTLSTNLGDDCDVAIFIGSRYGVQLVNPYIFGYFRQDGIRHDFTQQSNLPRFNDLQGNPYPIGGVNSGADSVHIWNPNIRGARRLISVLGALPKAGETTYTDPYYDELLGTTAADTRGASGASDFFVYGGKLTHRHHSNWRFADPTVDSGSGVLDQTSLEAEDELMPCAMFFDGLTTNASGGVQNMRTYGMRIACAEAFVIRMDRASNLGVYGGHFEGQTGNKPNTSGVDVDVSNNTLHSYGMISGTSRTGNLYAIGLSQNTEADTIPHWYGDFTTLEMTRGRKFVSDYLQAKAGTDFDIRYPLGQKLRLRTAAGATALQFDDTGLQFGASGPRDYWGTGSPEGVVSAVIGSTFRRTNGGAGTSFYVKESGTGNTGWVAK
jgi:hypothetical protein